jgi:hypothetical protein
MSKEVPQYIVRMKTRWFLPTVYYCMECKQTTLLPRTHDNVHHTR